DGLGARLMTVGLGNDLHRHLTRTEAGHLDRAGHALEASLDVLLDIGNRHGHVNAALQRARSFLVVFHQLLSRHGQSYRRRLPAAVESATLSRLSAATPGFFANRR